MLQIDNQLLLAVIYTIGRFDSVGLEANANNEWSERQNMFYSWLLLLELVVEVDLARETG